MARPRPLPERFWPKVAIGEPDDCWTWTASVNDSGYGSIGLGGRRAGAIAAHRAAYMLSIGPIPEGAHIDHKCHNGTPCPGGVTCSHRRCCNPAHLEAVTHQENVARGNAGKYQTLKTHCPQGHEYTPENTFDNNGGRGCKICRLAWNQKYIAKRKAA